MRGGKGTVVPWETQVPDYCKCGAVCRTDAGSGRAMPDSMSLSLDLAAKDAGVLVDQACDPLTGEGEKPSNDFSCEE